MQRIVQLALISVAVFATTGYARVVPHWSYHRLFDESDLVLLVHVTGTRDAVSKDPVVPLDKESDGERLTAVVTEMNVLAVLKGDYKRKIFVLPHYRLDWTKLHARGMTTITNGPNLAHFESEPKDISGPGWGAKVDIDYMVFLKHAPNGLYRCVTGQVDSEFSVRQMHLPLPNRDEP